MRSQGWKACRWGMALLLVFCAAPTRLQGQGSSPTRVGSPGHGDASLVPQAAEFTGTEPASVRWNSWARGLVGGHGGAGLPTKPLAVLSLAQWAAAEGASTGSAAAKALAVGVASAEVLKHLYPERAGPIAQMLEAELKRAGEGGVAERERRAAEAGGRAAAARVIARAQHLASDVKAAEGVPPDVGGWSSAAGMEPVGAAWGNHRPWVLSAASAVRPAAPPAPGSKEFEAELEQVRRATTARNEAQLQSAIKWAHASLPEYWNASATQLFAEHDIEERRATQILAVLNTALMDANIACFDAKYAYWYIRPSQVDSTIDVPVELPNFPAFPSGHACMSGAAAEVLSHYFPSSSGKLNAVAAEVAVSRLYAGVHYPIDNDTGLELGRRVGGLVLAELERTGIKAALP